MTRERIRQAEVVLGLHAHLSHGHMLAISHQISKLGNLVFHQKKKQKTRKQLKHIFLLKLHVRVAGLLKNTEKTQHAHIFLGNLCFI